MISDERNVSGGRGVSASTDDDFAGVCISVNKDKFIEKGPWWTSSEMMILDASQSVQMCDIEQIWVYHNSSSAPPSLLYDPTRIGDSISRYYAGRRERSGAEICALARTILLEQDDANEGNFVDYDPSDEKVLDAWAIVAQQFSVDEVAAFPRGLALIRCPMCMLAHPAGFVSCIQCFCEWDFSSDFPIEEVGVTPLAEPAVQHVELSSPEVGHLARVLAYGQNAWHIRSERGEFWREVCKCINWRLKWTTDYGPTPARGNKPAKPSSWDFRADAARNGHCPRMPGAKLDGSWVPRDRFDLGPCLRPF